MDRPGRPGKLAGAFPPARPLPGAPGVRRLTGRPTGTFVLSAGDREVQVESPQASDWYQYVSLDAGVLDIAAAGEQELVLRPAREWARM
jgi:hypothetical protein